MKQKKNSHCIGEGKKVHEEFVIFLTYSPRKREERKHSHKLCEEKIIIHQALVNEKNVHQDLVNEKNVHPYCTHYSQNLGAEKKCGLKMATLCTTKMTGGLLCAYIFTLKSDEKSEFGVTYSLYCAYVVNNSLF